MRISNIRHFLGGADQVIAREVLQGNQFLLNISGDENLDYSTATFTLATELFTADVTDGRSSITINSLTKDFNAPVQTYTGAALIRNTTQGSFDLKVPSTLLSDFNNGGNVFNASPDTVSPYIVAMKLQWTNGEEIKSIRFLFVIRYQPQ
jgi:hypothetical protein